MFSLIRLALQVGLKQYSLSDKASCRKFLLNLVAALKPMAAQTKTEIDDKILQQLEYILKNDVLFDYFYKLISDQFSTDAIIFEEVNESEMIAIVEQSSPEPLPEVINPILIVSLVAQVISRINAIKKITAAQTETEIDDKILQHLEYILKADATFDYCYKLISDQFSTDAVILEEVNESEMIAIVEQSSEEPLPEVISPILIVSLVAQVISLINAIKKINLG